MKTPNIFVIGCTHFGHAKMLDWGRDFASIEEHDNTLVERWNDTVGDGDVVYHLGDVFFGKKQKALETLTKLRGEKRLVLGNHDNEHLYFYMQHKGNDRMFKDVYVDLPLPDHGVILSHRPLHDTERYHYGIEQYLLNIHAHVHKRTLSDKNYFNACVENIDYTPLLLEDAVKRANGA